MAPDWLYLIRLLGSSHPLFNGLCKCFPSGLKCSSSYWVELITWSCAHTRAGACERVYLHTGFDLFVSLKYQISTCHGDVSQSSSRTSARKSCHHILFSSHPLFIPLIVETLGLEYVNVSQVSLQANRCGESARLRDGLFNLAFLLVSLQRPSHGLHAVSEAFLSQQ